VYLAYCDDSKTHDKKHDKFQVLATVVIEDKKFIYLEVLSRAVADSLIPADMIDQFEEFHASELYGGYGIFDGISQEERFSAIGSLLGAVNSQQIPIVYGAVNKSKLESTIYSSADPVHVCFTICMQGVEGFIGEHFPSDMALLIVDDFDKEIKKRCREAFRKFRTPLKTPIFLPGQSWHLHDDMYFGDSKESTGIQIADLCCFFIRKHLEASGDPAAEAFYNIIKDRIVYSRVMPDGEA
jgi:hypothetical protein